MSMGSTSAANATNTTIGLMMANIVPVEVATPSPTHGAGKESQP
ncbi:hypothetical protein [Aeromonas bivalvium]